jgi:hypothetical protein
MLVISTSGWTRSFKSLAGLTGLVDAGLTGLVGAGLTSLAATGLVLFETSGEAEKNKLFKLDLQFKKC